MENFDFLIEWDGAESEELSLLLCKDIRQETPQAGALNSHLVTFRRQAQFSHVLGLWMSNFGVPQHVQANPLYIAVLGATVLAMLSPRSIKKVPDHVAKVFDIFERSGFHRILSEEKLVRLMESRQLAQDAIKFMLDKKMIAREEQGYKLLEVPLRNVKIGFL